MKYLSVNIFLFFLFLFTNCRPEVKNEKEFAAWLFSENNEICRLRKVVNEIKADVCFMPPEYIAMRENGLNYNKQNKDSLIEYNSQILNFILIFSAEDKESDILNLMYKNLPNFNEYSERVLKLNFDLENKIELLVNGKSYSPSLCVLENTYGLQKELKINVAFVPVERKDEFLNIDKVELIYHDDTFDMGVLHYLFNMNEIKRQIPKVVL